RATSPRSASAGSSPSRHWPGPRWTRRPAAEQHNGAGRQLPAPSLRETRTPNTRIEDQTMKAYLRTLLAESRTDGNDLIGYLVLAVALVALPGALILFALLALLGVACAATGTVARAATAAYGWLATLLWGGRVTLAERLRDAATVIDPRQGVTAEPAKLVA